MSTTRPAAGGLKGFFQRTGQMVHTSADLAMSWAKIGIKFGYKYGGKFAFVIATTSMVVLMPLLFEIDREGQSLELERAQVKDLKSKGYSERQLQEMGFSDSALHAPSVASMNAK